MFKKIFIITLFIAYINDCIGYNYNYNYNNYKNPILCVKKSSIKIKMINNVCPDYLIKYTNFLLSLNL